MLLSILLSFIAIAIALAWFLVRDDHGPKEPVMALWFAFGIGGIGAIAAYFIESHTLSINSLSAGTVSHQLLFTTIVVGVIEESCKFIPLALLLYGRRYFNEHTDGVIYFALAGLGFGLPENLLYTLQGGTQTGLTRILLTPIFHAATTGMVGYFLARQKVSHRSILSIIGAFMVAILLHGLYDFGLLSGSNTYEVISILITLCLAGNLFYLYFLATEQDQGLGISIVGHNSYCRSCGTPNPRHHLYCIHCGKNA